MNLAVKERKNFAEKCKSEEQKRAAQRQQNMMQAHLRRETLRQKQEAEKAELSQKHLIATSQELHDVIQEIEAENTTDSKKRSKKLALVRTQIQIRKKILKQNIQIVLSRSRKQKPVSDIVEELSDFITRNSPFPEVLQNPGALVGSRINPLTGTAGYIRLGGCLSSKIRCDRSE